MEDVKSLEKASIKVNSVLVQRMVAHITKPTDYIKIVACIPDYVIVDTNQLNVEANFDKDYDYFFNHCSVLV